MFSGTLTSKEPSFRVIQTWVPSASLQLTFNGGPEAVQRCLSLNVLTFQVPGRDGKACTPMKRVRKACTPTSRVVGIKMRLSMHCVQCGTWIRNKGETGSVTKLSWLGLPCVQRGRHTSVSTQKQDATHKSSAVRCPVNPCAQALGLQLCLFRATYEAGTHPGVM